MKNRTTAPLGGIEVGRLALVGVVAMAVACASGGGSARMTVAEAEALVADYAGRWVLDESGSSPQIAMPRGFTGETTVVVSSQDREQVRREMETEESIRKATFEVLRRRPSTLALRVEGDQLVYSPQPGESIALPMDGGSISQLGGERHIRTRVFWQVGRLGLEHAVGSEGQVREVLEIIDGRLEMTRTIRVQGETVPPLVLVYDREGRLPVSSQNSR